MQTSSPELMSAAVTSEDGSAAVEFLLLDTAGAEVFADLSLACLADSYHVALVYDVSSRDSFLECQRWLEVCVCSLLCRPFRSHVSVQAGPSWLSLPLLPDLHCASMMTAVTSSSAESSAQQAQLQKAGKPVCSPPLSIFCSQAAGKLLQQPCSAGLYISMEATAFTPQIIQLHGSQPCMHASSTVARSSLMLARDCQPCSPKPPGSCANDPNHTGNDLSYACLQQLMQTGHSQSQNDAPCCGDEPASWIP